MRKQETVKSRKEREKVRKEKLAGYFFNLSQFTFTALVLGGVLYSFKNSPLHQTFLL